MRKSPFLLSPIEFQKIHSAHTAMISRRKLEIITPLSGEGA